MTPLERSWSIDASIALTLFIWIWFAWFLIKRRGGGQIPNLTSDHKSHESKGQRKFDWSVLYTIGKIFSKVIKYFPCTLEKDLIWELYERPKFWIGKVPILELPLGSPGKKWHLDVVPAKRYKVYYREGNGASSQRLRVGWSLGLRLSLLNPLHHFHLIYTNHPLLLVV
jgi:hypothetical protein